MATNEGNELTRSPEGKTSVYPEGLDKRFIEWVEKYKLSEGTISHLIREDLTNIEILQDFPIDEMFLWKLSPEDKSALCSALQSLQVGNFNTAKEFGIWASENGIKDDTIQELLSKGIDNMDKLAHTDDGVIKSLKITCGQRVVLKKAFSKLKGSLPQNVKDMTEQKSKPKDQNSKPNGKTGGGWIRKFTNLLGFGKTTLDFMIEYLNLKGTDRNLPKPITDEGMEIYKLPVKYDYIEKEMEIRKCTLGRVNEKKKQRTIMMVGATGSGKSTLIDGLCNYIFDVKYDEKERFKLIDESTKEIKNKQQGQVTSQTEWITIYSIQTGNPNKLDYTLNIIDTPGFGDTRGIERDQNLVKQVKTLFSERGGHDIDEIDAVCFVIRAPDVRLNASQRYIFDSILSIFGKNIEGNILVMCTFADGGKPPALEAIKGAELPYKKEFRFNNSAVFGSNSNQISKLFWEIYFKSFDVFFNILPTLEAKSLCLSGEVLEQRHKLKDNLTYLERQIQMSLNTMTELEHAEKKLKENENRLEDLKDFTYTVTKYSTKKVFCATGTYSTHCTKCQETCHDACMYKEDKDKVNCVAIDPNGKCMRCKNNCLWEDHSNTGYFLEHIEELVEQTYESKLREYEVAKGIVAEKQTVIDVFKYEQDKCASDIKQKIRKCRGILQVLKYIALKPGYLTEADYIEELIIAEKIEAKKGWEGRVVQLENLKKEALLSKTLQHDDLGSVCPKEFLEQFKK